jgi:hypothetical protein
MRKMYSGTVAGVGSGWIKLMQGAAALAVGAQLTTLASISPAPGESGVAVTRETILRFTHPLAADAVLTLDQFRAKFGERQILSRVAQSLDRRTAVRSQWPGGAYYPFVAKAWEGIAGRTDVLVNGNGEVYLPLIRPGSSQVVNSTESTRVTCPAEVVADRPELRDVEVIVPANSLFADDGTRGGRVGIAPVAPDRLPEPLPPGLAWQLDYLAREIVLRVVEAP